MKSNQVNILLEELKKTTQILESFIGKESIPEIEKDLVLSKLRNMYELIRFDHAPAEPEPAGEIQWEPETEPVKAMNEPTPEHFEPELTIPEAEIKKPEPVREIKEEKATAVEKTVSHTKTPSSAKKEILAEKFQKQSFLNEALAQYQNMMDLSKKIQNQPISDISSAINFNEKFLFIKELFSNNSALYQTTMEKINHAGNFNDAVRYLDEHFLWDFNDPQVQKLLELIRRRYHNQ